MPNYIDIHQHRGNINRAAHSQGCVELTGSLGNQHPVVKLAFTILKEYLSISASVAG